jgi:Tfp pilus assembly protein PilF
MFCTACGTKNPADSHFCKQCGKKIEATTAVKIDETEYVRAMPEEEQVTALLENAYLHRSRGDLDGAIALCEEAIRLKPDNPSAHALIAQIAVQQGDKDRAIREYERVVAISPNSIADRIKLEELREGRSHHAVRGGQPSESSAFNPLMVVAACAGLLVLGAVMGDQFKRSQGKDEKTPLVQTAGTLPAQPQAGSGGANTSSQQPPTGNQPLQQPQGTGQALLPGMGQGNTNPTNTMQNTAQTGTPTASTDMGQPQPQIINAPPFYPPVVVNPPANNSRPLFTNFPRGTARRSGNGTIVPLPIGGGSIEPNPTRVPGTREHLEDKGQPYTVKIDVGNPTANSGNTNSSTVPAVNNANPASDEARTAIEVANNHILKNDFKSAIKSLKAALKNPGNKEGWIHQQIGYCYQQTGDKTSGRTHYEHALSAYENMSKQGVQKEIAEDGIRASRKGIKQCEQ